MPLRVRTEGVPRLRPAFPGTALVLGERIYEVVSEDETARGVVYGLRPWPEGEVVRDRVLYGPRLVHAAKADRARAATRERVRPWRVVLHPLVGLLPEEHQERWADRLGLYAVTATLTSGLSELVVFLLAIGLIARSADEGLRVVLALAAPVLAVLALSGLGRAFAAAAFRQTRGQCLVELAFAATKTVRHAGAPRDPTLVPLTREAFWTRLETPDRVTREKDGSLVFRGLLPHLSWRTGHHVRGGQDHWLVEALPTALERGRLVFSYRLTAPPGRDPAAPPPEPPPADAYASEVKASIRREWDDLLGGFSWLASLLSTAVQERAFAPRGGPAAARRAVWTTALAELVFAAYVLVQPVQPSDPVGPWLRLLGAALVIDAALRAARTRQGAYAPSILRAVLPSRSLRPERIAYQEHRDAERQARLRLQS
ncbi:MAG TPA: hypothetical protein VLL75_07800 [Vicinamibacteria bacterium]|nr:hypothetical protein [Vicinamibacteria bacterium]